MRSPARWLVALAGLAAFAGCAGTRLRERNRATSDLVHQVREAGARQCAPRELAIAETNVEFADRELDKGDYFRAKEHVQIAAVAVREARKLTQPGVCEALTEVAPAPPPAPGDADGDGLLDPDDKCPKEAEDKDGFEDEDGCPELDNDHDAVADAKDRCPNEAEDADGFEDEDGCPDTDNDKDGVADAKDRCPKDPEDKDGFEDEDGCPDTDNDKDGIADAADKCPNEAGPAGTNGCPQKFQLITVTKDKIELKQTIYFETAKARIQPRSYPLLDEVAAVPADLRLLSTVTELEAAGRRFNDDITMLLIELDEPLLSLRIPADPRELAQVRSAVQEIADAEGCGAKCTADIVMAVNEACMNIIQHAYKGDPNGVIELHVRRDDGMLEVVLRDSAPPVDLDEIRPRPLEDLRPGGLGTFFIRETMDDCTYGNLGGCNGNFVRMTKRIAQ